MLWKLPMQLLLAVFGIANLIALVLWAPTHGDSMLYLWLAAIGLVALDIAQDVVRRRLRRR